MKKERLGFHIILLGQITAGKETQANILMKKYSLAPVESGKYWRTLSLAKTPEGDLLRKTTSKGLPAPVSLMKKFLKDHLDKKPKNKDLIFIGNPRLKPEAQLLKKLLQERKEDFIAFYLNLSDKDVYLRSVSRQEGNMADVYKMLDNKKIVARRIRYHKEQVSKTVKYFESLGKMKKINGKQSIEKVASDIQKTVDIFRKKIKEHKK